ncbi:MAG: patatin-like phospholipase family protein [Persicimonas sp.]
MSRFGRHFARIRELKACERRFLRLVVDHPGAVHPHHEALFRYALALAQLNLFRTPERVDVSLSEEVDGLRSWMIESIVPLLPAEGDADVSTLREMAPVLALRVERTRSRLLERHLNDFGPEDLDRELRQKRLVLVLGGGGGAGLVHLGTFSMLKELGVTPELIVGSSMGSVMGLLRALDESYDPVSTALSLPKNLSYNELFRPFTGFSRFGFPGAFHMNLLRVARKIFRQLLGQTTVPFSDLAIPLEVIACGIRRGYEVDDAEYEQEDVPEPDSLSPLDVTRKLRLFFKAVRQLSKNPRFLTQVVFGRDELTRDFPVIEAVGFSCAVPGLLHYDIFHDDPETVEPLEALFERDNLLRLCDGGVINNVPSQVAWESVQSGTIGTRNVHIAAFDAFAPVARGRNLLWIPIQQIARPAVVANRPYSDHHKTFRDPPNPLQVLVNSYSKVKSIVQTARAELEDDAAYLERALEPLPPYGTWEIP